MCSPLSIVLLTSLLFLLRPSCSSAAKLKFSSEEEDAPLPTRATKATVVRASSSSDMRNSYPQEVANCPHGCTCNTSSISCVNTDYDGASVFTQMQPLAFPHLDTLIMSGNRLADLSADSLFGADRVHKRLTLVNLTDNRITSISAQTFLGMPQAEYVYLRNNLISTSSRNPFGALSKLKLLDLSAAFRESGRTPEFIHSLFEGRRSALQKLQEIDLSNNGLYALNSSTFCRLPGLARLLLSGNSLTSFNVRVAGNCLSGLQHLDLSANSIQSLPPTLWDTLPSLTAVDLSSNPLHCDCKLKPLVELVQQDSNHFLNQGKTLCATPPALAGSNVFSLEVSLLCSSSPLPSSTSSSSSSSILGHLFLLAIFAVVAFTLYRFYRHRIPSPPTFQFGYSSLNEREEPEPHFV